MFFGGDPFEHFAGMPGGPGMGGGRRAASRDVDTTKLYETLGVEKTADDKTIKKAYRKLAVKHHPDKGGDEAKFKEISAAYEILSDKEKRSKYDKYGLEGVADESGDGAGADDLFSMFFGGGRSRRSGPRKGENVNHPIKVSLEDLYNGKTMKLAITREVLVGEAYECESCDGQGVVVELRQIALGMVQQIQRNCAECGGQGHCAESKKERKVLEVHIDKGMKHNEKVVFRGMADEKPNLEPGDINFIVQEKEHERFKRKGADLLITKTLSLNEALCGFEWMETHLDGRQILIQSTPGEVIKALTGKGTPYTKIVPGEGMPSRGNPFVKGNLYVLFRLEFPGNGEIPAESIETLKKVLPNPAPKLEYEEDDVEIFNLDEADISNFGKGGAVTHNDAYDSDEEDGQQQVQCQQS